MFASTTQFGLTQALDIAKRVLVKVINLLGIIVAGGAALVAYDIYSSKSAETSSPPPQAAPRRVVVTPTVDDRSWIKPKDNQAVTSSAPQTACDGRTTCPQMRSCEEAKYFIQHCPNTSMDGDRDGIPCEEQWCGH